MDSNVDRKCIPLNSRIIIEFPPYGKYGCQLTVSQILELNLMGSLFIPFTPFNNQNSQSNG